MAVLGGKYCAIGGVSTVANWMLRETTTPARYRASNTYAGTARAEGVYDYSGTIEGKGGTPPYMPGDYFDFDGYTAPGTGARGAAGITKSATNAIVEAVRINWNWNTGEVLSWGLDFAQGEPVILTEASGIVVDNSLVIPEKVCPTKITVTNNDTIWPNLLSATLTITGENPTSVNSSTAGKTLRRPGPIDWTLAIQEHNDRENANLNLSTCLGSRVGGATLLKIWTDATLYWLLEHAHYEGMSDLRVDAMTGEIIGQSHNFAMSGVVEESVPDVTEGTIGVIGRPGEDGASNPYWWPDTFIANTLPF